MVWDNILENLERADLVSVSQTCRSLHRRALKYLYRDLTFPKNDDWWHPHVPNREKAEQVQSSLRRDPTLLPYIRSFSSYNSFFLQWMYTQATIPALEYLDLREEFIRIRREIIEKQPDFVESIPFQCRHGIRNLILTIN